MKRVAWQLLEQSNKETNVLDLYEKIQFIIDNERCEGAEAYQGLQTFLYTFDHLEKVKQILPVIEELTTVFYESVLKEVMLDYVRLDKIRNGEIFCSIINGYNGEKFIKVGNRIFDKEFKEVQLNPEMNYVVLQTLYL